MRWRLQLGVWWDNKEKTSSCANSERVRTSAAVLYRLIDSPVACSTVPPSVITADPCVSKPTPRWDNKRKTSSCDDSSAAPVLYSLIDSPAILESRWTVARTDELNLGYLSYARLLGRAWASLTLTRGLGPVSVYIITKRHSVNVWNFLIND